MPTAAMVTRRLPGLPRVSAPPPYMDVAEIAAELNAAERQAGRPADLEPKWNRWNTRSVCEAQGIRFVQQGTSKKLWAKGEDLLESGMWLLIVKIRERDGR